MNCKFVILGVYALILESIEKLSSKQNYVTRGLSYVLGFLCLLKDLYV